MSRGGGMQRWLMIAQYMPAGRWMDCDEIHRSVPMIGGKEPPYGALRRCWVLGILDRRPAEHDARRIQYRKIHKMIERVP